MGNLSSKESPEFLEKVCRIIWYDISEHPEDLKTPKTLAAFLASNFSNDMLASSSKENIEGNIRLFEKVIKMYKEAHISSSPVLVVIVDAHVRYGVAKLILK